MNKALFKYGLLFFVLLSAPLNGWLQDEDIPFDKRLFEDDKSGFDEAVKAIKLGDFYFFDGRDEFLTKALTHYMDAQKFNPYSSILNYKIGICYLYSLHKTKSLRHLKFAYRVNPELDEQLPFYLAQSYQLCGDFETAISFYEMYQSTIPANDEKQQRYVAKKIEESQTGMAMMANPVRVWVDNMGEHINTEFAEFSPVISADNRVLFYTARRPDSYGQEKDRNGNFYEDIYYTTRHSDSTWSVSKNIGPPINTKSHDATVGLAPDGKSILTYHGISAKDGDILITRQQDDGNWATPSPIGLGINSKHHESSATLSFDEKTLFFVSDRPGGFGQHDIYVSYWDEATEDWTPAQNLGPTINTDYEEKGVFYHANSKTLYFSSNGHNNMGGLDIFKSVFNPEDETWTAPENLGYPINTPDDDIYFVVTGNERYAYYSSNRPGGFGEKDIYKITFLGPEKKPALPQPDLIAGEPAPFDFSCPDLAPKESLFLLKGQLIDGETNEGISGQIYVVDAQTNQKIKEVATNAAGHYSLSLEVGKQYALTAAGNEFNIASKALNALAITPNSTSTVDFTVFAPSREHAPGHTFVLRNIYFGFDQSSLDYEAFGSQSQVELDLLADLMQRNPNMTVELAGHTDRRGSNDYNLKLSEIRAQIAKQYLIKKGVDEKRIQTTGYGEGRPEVTSSQIRALKTRKEKEEAHQRNRRTVVTILTH